MNKHNQNSKQTEMKQFNVLANKGKHTQLLVGLANNAWQRELKSSYSLEITHFSAF